jgi:hypothetical protein
VSSFEEIRSLSNKEYMELTTREDRNRLYGWIAAFIFLGLVSVAIGIFA